MSRPRTTTDMLHKDPADKEATLILYLESNPGHWHM